MADLNNSYEEYKEFLQIHLFPILGFPNENNIEECNEQEEERTANKLVFQKGEYVYFCNKKQAVYKVKRTLNADEINLSVNIIQSFFKVSKYKMNNRTSSINNDYYSTVQRKANYKMAIQKGICDWIVGSNNDKIEELFEILEKWSVQTYEGKKVTFGFIINPEVKSSFDNQYGSWCDFLNDDFSAVFTDCINTVIELDRECNFNRYLSITENDQIDNCSLNHNSAFRFSNILQKFVKDKCVGVFLLNNGDIILSKNGAIAFVKRNLKWLNFGYGAFKNALSDFLEKKEIEESILQSVFASMLDVSFAHTGGIIALVEDINNLLEEDDNNKEAILNPCDYLLNDKSEEEINSYLKQKIKDKSERNKRILKRKVIDALVENKEFSSLDRKLRSELISLDGACIIDKQGRVCSCGAIIKNDSGSTGGGRGAASKKLSRYGFSVKISTDGYIELYIDGDLKYSIK